MDFKKNPPNTFKDIQNMSKEEARGQVKALREGIEYHDYLYYVKNQPEISDALYDKLFHRLQDRGQGRRFAFKYGETKYRPPKY